MNTGSTVGEQLATLSHSDLTAKIKQLQATCNADEERHAQLHAEQRSTAATLRTLEERQLLTPEDEQLHEQIREARRAKAACEDRLRAHPEQARQRRAVLASAASEHRKREEQLRSQVRAECIRKWQATGTPEGFIDAARRVLAEAIIRFAHHHTMEPTMVGVQGFIDSFIHPLEVARLVEKAVEKEQAKVKERCIKESEGRYGY